MVGLAQRRVERRVRAEVLDQRREPLGAAPAVEQQHGRGGERVSGGRVRRVGAERPVQSVEVELDTARHLPVEPQRVERSEEHTSELQSRQYLLCRLLLENKRL